MDLCSKEPSANALYFSQSDKKKKMVPKTELHAEVTKLKRDISRLPQTPIPLSAPASVPPPLISRSSPSKSRFSRFRAPFRRMSSAGTKKLAQADQGTSSTESLVGKTNLNPPITQTHSRDTASDLLSLLAPLVSSLQTLGLKIKESENADQETIDIFRVCCTDLEDRIEIYNTPIPSQDAELNAHDFEMRTLLLNALAKKVIAERTTCPDARSQTPLPLNASPALSRINSTNGNPFVLHSSDIIGSRRSSTPDPRPIPIGAAPSAGHGGGMGLGIGTGMGRGTHLGPYPSFADASHHTGLSNVFRLGSFQNSLLFSPSPVAVRQPLAASGMQL